MYKVYILKCSDNTLYTWITTDLNKRIRQHNWEILGWAKYTLARKPVELLYFESAKDRSEASKREYFIKKLKRVEKMKLINKKQIVLIKWWTSKENYKDFYDFLENQEFDPYAEKTKRWNISLWEDLWEWFEVLEIPMPNRDFADYNAWKIVFEKHFNFFKKDVTFIGHSLGWTFLAKYFNEKILSTEDFYPQGALRSPLNKWKEIFNFLKIILVAPAFKDDKNEVLGNFNFEKNLENLKTIQEKITIFASKDDFVVDFSDIEDFQKVLPNSEYKIFENKWHFLQEDFEELIEEIK